MAQWIPKRWQPGEINSGNRFEGGQPINNADFNRVYETALKTDEMIDNMGMQLTGEDGSTPSVTSVFDPITNIPTLNFLNTASAPIWLTDTAPTGGTTLAKSAVTNPSNVRGYLVGDLIFISSGVEQGNIYRITAVTAAGANITVVFQTSLRGTRGVGIFTTTAQINAGNTNIALSTITIPSGIQLQAGELVMSTAAGSPGAIGRVTTIAGTTITVQFVSSIGNWRIWIRYNTTGVDAGATTTWSSGQNWIGIRVSTDQTSPTTGYTWSLFVGATTITRTSAQWTANDTVLSAGQFGLDTTTNLLRIGDGVRRWSQLPALFAPQQPSSFATDSWETIARVAEGGIAGNFYSVGDTRNITLTNGQVMTVRIIGFNHDNLIGGGTAGITMEFRHLMHTTHQMNATNTNAGGWQNSNMRTVTMDMVYHLLPSQLQTRVKRVNKMTANGGSQAGTTVVATQDFCFLFSEREIFGHNNNSRAGEGTQYSFWIGNNTNAARIKNMNNGTGSAQWWWLRSPWADNTNNFCNVGSAGAASLNTAFNSFGVSAGFCI